MLIPSMSTANSVRYRPPEYIELKTLARSESTYGGISSTSSLQYSAPRVLTISSWNYRRWKFVATE